jgi:hypothetical protein
MTTPDAARPEPELAAKLSQKTSSRYKGVFWDTGRQKWRARIRVGGKVKTLGSFDSEDEAAAAYRKARQEIDESEVKP